MWSISVAITLLDGVLKKRIILSLSLFIVNVFLFDCKVSVKRRDNKEKARFFCFLSNFRISSALFLMYSALFLQDVVSLHRRPSRSLYDGRYRSSIMTGIGHLLRPVLAVYYDRDESSMKPSVDRKSE